MDKGEQKKMTKYFPILLVLRRKLQTLTPNHLKTVILLLLAACPAKKSISSSLRIPSYKAQTYPWVFYRPMNRSIGRVESVLWLKKLRMQKKP
uniref:Uncharacterized protein n=1 Tax=Acrobeloides nanus TaxID=290746 RepID=A0A914C3B5_9BILA